MKKLIFSLFIGFIVGGIAGLFESIVKFSVSKDFVLLYFYSIIIYAIIGIITSFILGLIFIKFKKKWFKILVSTGLIGSFIFLNIADLLRNQILLGIYLFSLIGISLYSVSLIISLVIAYCISYYVIKFNFKKISIGFSIFILLLLSIGIIINNSSQEGKESVEVKESNLDNPNIIFIIINSWRADRISKDITPNIYNILKNGTYFKKCISAAPTTIIADLSIITGVYPNKHGIRHMGNENFNESIKTLAEILKKNGYETAGFVGSWALNSIYGFNRGFHIYYDYFNFLDKISPSLSSLNYIRLFKLLGFIKASEIKADEVNEKINIWLGEDHKKPFFLFIHYFDPHMPYEPPEIFFEDKYSGPADGTWDYYHAFKTGKIELNKKDVKHMINLYNNEIRFVDKSIGELLNKIKDNDTIIIIAGDHGEALGEHNEYFDHGNYLYDEQIVVPVIIKSSKLPNKVISKQIRSVDILPTILDLIDIKKPQIIDGVSLVPLVIRDDFNLLAYSETFYIQNTFGIRTDKWKYIIGSKGEELYSLEDDPKEIKNLAKEEIEIVNNFRNLLSNILGKESVELLFKKKNIKKVRDISRERLKELGYII